MASAAQKERRPTLKTQKECAPGENDDKRQKHSRQKLLYSQFEKTRTLKEDEKWDYKLAEPQPKIKWKLEEIQKRI